MLRPITNVRVSPDYSGNLYRTIDIGCDEPTSSRVPRRVPKKLYFKSTFGKRLRPRTFRVVDRKLPHEFNELPRHAFQIILSKLSPLDVFNLRTAGLGLENLDHRELSRDVVKYFKRQLIMFMASQSHQDVHRNFRPYLPKHWVSFCPDEYVPPPGVTWHEIMTRHRGYGASWPPRAVKIIRLRFVQVSYVTAELLHFMAVCLPRLYRITIFDRNKDLYEDNVGVVPVVWRLPRELSLCTQVRSFELYSMKDHLPEALFEMHFLEELILNVLRLTSLPEVMGQKLQNLRFLSAEKCPLTMLPDSIIETVRRNQLVHEERRCGIVVSSVNFRRSYWIDKLGIVRPPKYVLRHQPGSPNVVYLKDDVDFSTFRDENNSFDME